MKFNSLAVQCPDLKPFDQPDGQCSYQYGRTNDALHMKTLQPEHFLNPEPGNHLGFDEDDAEKNSHYEVTEVLVPFIFDCGIIHADRVQ